MQATFPRAVVDELRKKSGNYRHRSKVFLEALIKSESAHLGLVVSDVPDAVMSMVDVTPSGEIIGMSDALTTLRTK